VNNGEFTQDGLTELSDLDVIYVDFDSLSNVKELFES